VKRLKGGVKAFRSGGDVRENDDSWRGLKGGKAWEPMTPGRFEIPVLVG